MDRHVRTGLILFRIDASVNMIMNLRDSRGGKKKVSQLAEGVCSPELNITFNVAGYRCRHGSI